MNKKFASVITAVLLIAGLSACGNDAPPAVQPPSPVSAVDNSRDMDQNFIDTVRDQGSSEFDAWSDSELIHAGHQMCDLLGEYTVEEAVTSMVEADIPANMGGTLLGASVGAYCPQYTSELQDFINQSQSY